LIRRALTKPDIADKRTGFVRRSSPLKRQEVESASKNTSFAMTSQKKFWLWSDFVKAVA
jgi:hypothetical protein